ncbi:hypothetical protein LMG33818_002453 [Halomonadaceae bacterium LMG 33818]
MIPIATFFSLVALRINSPKSGGDTVILPDRTLRLLSVHWVDVERSRPVTLVVHPDIGCGFGFDSICRIFSEGVPIVTLWIQECHIIRVYQHYGQTFNHVKISYYSAFNIHTAELKR